ncbi:unnamed protein product [Camellia sinensis]
MMLFHAEQAGDDDASFKLEEMWKEWELRGMILLSLTTQIVLVLLGNRRKYVSGTWIRIMVWLAYLPIQ